MRDFFARPRRWSPFAFVAVLAASPDVRAADPQPYTVQIASTGDAALDMAINDSATLVTLREKSAVGPFALVARARSDVPRVVTALNSYGYYLGSATITITTADGRARGLDDPDLPAALDAQTGPVVVHVVPTAGALFHLGHVALTGDVPPGSATALDLPSGAPARAADVLAARSRLQTALRDQTRVLATVAAPVATLDVAHTTLDVSYAVAAGPRVDIGAITITGATRLREPVIRRLLDLHTGEPFDPKLLDQARQDLTALPAVGGVALIPGTALDPNGRVPLSVQVSERKRHAVELGASFSTDQGGSVTASWTDRDVSGGGEQLTLSASATEIGGSASRQAGYDVEARFAVPQSYGGTLTYDAQDLLESLDAYRRRAAVGSVIYSRKLTKEVSVNGGVSFEQARIDQEGVTRSYSLPQLPLGVTFDSTGSLFDPIHGVRASLTVTPTDSLGSGGGQRSAFFLITQASASTYLDLGAWLFGKAPGRSVLAVRGLVGDISGAGTFDVPPDQRFYAGGGGTVRGYRYQSIGPRFADNRPVGGTRVEVGSVEFRQRFGQSFGAVVFADAGEVTARDAAFPGGGAVQIGAGAGVRYYTSFGPIRVDVAVPLNKQANQKTDVVEAYIGLGQAF